MSEPRKIRHLLTLLEDRHRWSDWVGDPEPPAPQSKTTRTDWKTEPKTGKEYTTYKDTGQRYQRINPKNAPDKKLDTNIDGWRVPGTLDSSKADSTEFQKGLSQLAKDYGVDSPRAFTANLNPSIGAVKGFDNPDTSGTQAGMYSTSHPGSYRSELKLKKRGIVHHRDEDLAHELAHHNSMNFGAVDAEGNMRIVDNHKGETMGITGFGMSGKDETGGPADRFLSVHNKYADEYGSVNQKGLRGELYDKVMNNLANKQRPELKHGLATAVSHILSDPKILSMARWGWEKDYGYAPEEMWARGMAEFSRLKRLPPDERFSDPEMQITPTTYKKIQELMDAIKVKYGHTLAKRPGQQGPSTA